MTHVGNCAVSISTSQRQDIGTCDPCLVDTVVNDHASVREEIGLIRTPAQERILIQFAEYLSVLNDFWNCSIFPAQLYLISMDRKKRDTCVHTSPT